MQLNRFPNSKQTLAGWLAVLCIMGAFAIYQYSDGYDYAKDHLITQEAICDNTFSHGRRSLRFFKVMGCKSQVADRQQKLESHLGFEASNVSDDEIFKRMKQEIKNKERRRFNDRIGNCQADPEGCVDNLTEAQNQMNGDGVSNEDGFEPAPSAQTGGDFLPPEDCDDVDPAGYLPEC